MCITHVAAVPRTAYVALMASASSKAIREFFRPDEHDQQATTYVTYLKLQSDALLAAQRASTLRPNPVHGKPVLLLPLLLPLLAAAAAWELTFTAGPQMTICSAALGVGSGSRETVVVSTLMTLTAARYGRVRQMTCVGAMLITSHGSAPSGKRVLRGTRT